MNKTLILLIILLLPAKVLANYSADLISIKNIRVTENGDYIVKPEACHAGACTCSDYWAGEAYSLTNDAKKQQLSLLLAAHTANKKAYVYYNNEDGQCRQKQISIESD